MISIPARKQPLMIVALQYSLVTILFGYGTLCLGLYLVQEQLIFPNEYDPPDTRYSFSRAFEEVFIPVADARLHALWFRVPDPKGVVVFFHGNGGTLRTWGHRAIAFVDRGYDVFMVDYRSYGQSTGRIQSEVQLFADARAVYTWVREHYRDEQIVLYGSSLGTSFASRLAAEYQPRLLILESPFYSVEELARRRFPWAPSTLLKYPLRSYSWIGQITCPVIIFHGTADQVVPFDHSERLAAHLTAPLMFYRIVGGNHVDTEQYPIYHQALDIALGPLRQPE